MLEIRGGVLQGRTMTAAEVESLATLPPLDVLRGQVLGAIIAPVTALAGLVNAPLQNLYGLIDARIEQLGRASDAAPEPAPKSRLGEAGAEERCAEEPEAAEEEPAAEGDGRRRTADATASAPEDRQRTETTKRRTT